MLPWQTLALELLNGISEPGCVFAFSESEDVAETSSASPIRAGSEIRTARHAQTREQGGFLLPYAKIFPVLQGIFSYYSDKKGLCAAHSFSELKC